MRLTAVLAALAAVFVCQPVYCQTLKTDFPELVPRFPATYTNLAAWSLVHHMQSASGSDDFYTSGADEYKSVLANLHYKDLGTVGYAYTGGVGAVPIYRFCTITRPTSHFYTADSAYATSAPPGYKAEGIVGYVVGDRLRPSNYDVLTSSYSYTNGDGTVTVGSATVYIRRPLPAQLPTTK